MLTLSLSSRDLHMVVNRCATSRPSQPHQPHHVHRNRRNHRQYAPFLLSHDSINTTAAVASLTPLDSTAAGGAGTSLLISNAEIVLTDVHLGDSIAVNGKTSPHT